MARKPHSAAHRKAISTGLRKHHATKSWVAKAIRHPGALHKALGISKDKTIPLKLIRDAAKANTKVGKEARLALTLRSFKRK